MQSLIASPSGLPIWREFVTSRLPTELAAFLYPACDQVTTGHVAGGHMAGHVTGHEDSRPLDSSPAPSQHSFERCQDASGVTPVCGTPETPAATPAATAAGAAPAAHAQRTRRREMCLLLACVTRTPGLPRIDDASRFCAPPPSSLLPVSG